MSDGQQHELGKTIESAHNTLMRNHATPNSEASRIGHRVYDDGPLQHHVYHEPEKREVINVQTVQKAWQQDNEADTTYSYDDTDREQFNGRMIDAGYSESDTPFRCGTCEYMQVSDKSSTGYWCAKFMFPDRPEGCCRGYEKKENL